MGMNPNPDESDVLDLNIGLRDLCDYVDADGIRTTRERAIVDRFEQSIMRIAYRVNARIALESIFRNGPTDRYTRTKANDAGLIVVAMDGHVLDIVPQDPEHPNDPQNPKVQALRSRTSGSDQIAA